jgi:hypothetical protein
MAEYPERVKETITLDGYNDIVLTGAVAGFRTLSATVSIGDYVRYFIESNDGVQWEGGYGELLTSTTLSREEVTDSSNSGVSVNFTAGAGTVSIGAFPEMRKTEGLLSEVGLVGDLPSGVPTALEISVVPVYDTSEILAGRGSLTVMPIPAWVSKIKVTAQITFSGDLTGTRAIWIAGPGLGSGIVGAGDNFVNSDTTAAFPAQIIPLNSAIIPVPDPTGLVLVALQDSGVSVPVQGFIAVEFIE